MEKGKPTTVDEYLATVREDQRLALQNLRQTIRSVVPLAEEYFYYGMPAFRLNGKPLVAFRAASKHCAFHPLSGGLIAAHQDELQGYDTSKGTIRFPANRWLPAALVRKLVKARIREQQA